MFLTAILEKIMMSVSLMNNHCWLARCFIMFPLHLSDCIIILNAVVLITHTIMLSAANIPITHDLHVTWDQITVVSSKLYPTPPSPLISLSLLRKNKMK